MSQFIEMFGDQNTNDKGWSESLVKDEFKLSMGKTPARNNPECWDNGNHKWVSISDMSSYARYTGDTSEYITDYAIADSGIKPVPKGTIIMSFKLSIGRTAITSEDIYTNEAIMAFADFDEKKFNIDFLHFLIANKNWLLGAKQAVKGQTLNKESIGNAKIIIPPIEMQEQFASIYNQADKSEFVGFKSQFIEMFENVESYCKLEDLISDTFPGEWGSEPISENAIKVIRTTNFTNEGYLDLTDVVTRDIEPKKVVRKKLKQGDTILERSGGTKDNPVGRVVFFDEIGDYLPNNFTQVLRPKESVNPVYLFYALYNSYNLNKAAMRAMASQTTGIQNLSMSDFMAKSIVLPSRDEQNKFEQIYRQADKSEYYN